MLESRAVEKRSAPQRRSSWLIGLALVGALVPASAAAAASPHPALQKVSYRGHAVEVPASWPVYDLSADPTRCVRFDRHAVYLGRPSAAQRCPAHAVGRPQAVLIEPSGVVRRADGVSPASAAGSPTALGNRLVPRTARRRASASSTYYTGLGFDACAAPSTTTMTAWLSSPYRAIGVYIGGINRGCSQPNLTSTWVATEIAAGWQLIPTYVGLQAPTNSCGCAAIRPSQATIQGTVAADDAVTQAAALGIGAGSPIYFDMEGYATGGTNSSAVLTFLGAWTAELHARGYVSGVYGSGSSTVADLVGQYGGTVAEPDDIWFAHWNLQQSTSDPTYLPATDWANHQRIHQYRGGHNESYGGVTINIDNDYLDGAVVGTASRVVTLTRIRCRRVVFSHRLRTGAFKIRAVGVSHCGKARRIASASRPRRFASFGNDRSYSKLGFVCRGHRVGRARVIYGCANGRRQVSFARNGSTV